MSDATDIIASAQTYASDSMEAGVSAMNEAMAALNALGSVNTNFISGAPVIQPPTPGDAGDVPDYVGIHLDPDLFTDDAPFLQTVPALVLPNDPTPPPADLVYVAPQVPSGFTPDASLLSDIPTLNDVPAAPTMPDLQGEIAGIAAPVLVPITIPDAPVYVPPEFLGTAPVFSATMPTDLDDTFRTNFDTIGPILRAAVNDQLDGFIDREFPQFRSGMAAIEDRLATYLAGGSALSPDVETAMFNRTLDRTNAEGRRSSQEAWGKGARAGFTIIGATLLSQQQDIDQARRDNNAKAATEIYIKQAELEQSNLQFAVTKSTELRKIALDAALSYYSGLVQINAQALQYARDIVDQIVKAFDIAARYAETQARIYEADAAVYRAKVDGAMSIIRAYEAAVNAELAKANVNRAVVDAYTARINAVRAEADVYRAAVDAIVSLAGLERIKVELYDSKVKAFGSQVNAFTAQWQGYEAAVKGQTARMEVNVAHSREYEAAAGAYSAIVHGRSEAVKAASENNRQLVDTYRAKVAAFAELQHAKAEAVQIDVSIYKATIEAFIARATAIMEEKRSEVAVYEVALRGLIEEARLGLEHVRDTNALNIERARGLAQLAGTIGGNYGHLAEAALNGMNALGASITTTTA